MLSCSIWFSAPSLWMDGGLEKKRKMHGQTTLKFQLCVILLYTNFNNKNQAILFLITHHSKFELLGFLQHRIVVSYRLFGTTYRSHIKTFFFPV